MLEEVLKHYGEEDHGEITQTQGLGGNTDEIAMEEEMEVEMEQGQEIQQQEPYRALRFLSYLEIDKQTSHQTAHQ